MGAKDKDILGECPRRRGVEVTDSHEKENKRAGEDAEAAYAHPDTPECRSDCISQLNSLYGPAIDEEVVMHKMGATVLRHLQVNQYLRYWKNWTEAGVWAYKADVEGHVAACRRAQRRTQIRCKVRLTRR